MPFTLPNLPYDGAALEPHIDARTMDIHRTKHHNTYVTNLNNLLSKHPELDRPIAELMPLVGTLPDDAKGVVRNSGGGHWNHDFFWQSLTPKGTGAPVGKLADAITADFGSFDAFKEKFAAAAASRFGSGWAWLIVKDGKLAITSTPNQDNPLMDIAEVKGTPVVGLDVWEHAYYLHYQNRRPDYVTAWWNVVNWEYSNGLYEKAK
jgi:superoxide dismutase, Fe-Mn family